MKFEKRDPDKFLDRAVTEIRNEQIDAAEVSRAASEVWAELSHELNQAQQLLSEVGPVQRIRNCADFQALIPAYLSGSLTQSRATLLEDHTGECVPCRKALRLARSGQDRQTLARPQSLRVAGRSPLLKWALAAAALAAIGLTQLDPIQNLLLGPPQNPAMAQSIQGSLFRVSGQASQPVAAGERISRREAVRTGQDSGAILELADGSRVEMRERSELSLLEARNGTTIELKRGSIIVQAAKQRRGHLYVATEDCRVAVTGTVFSVSRGAKGSRVSVIEGEVSVEYGNSKEVLRAGQQLSTHPGLQSVPVEQEIAWSRDVDAHIALLRELTALGKGLEGKLSGPGLRYGSTLLNLVPEETVVYAAFPNITSTLGQAYDLLRQRITENPTLNQWWSQNAQSSGRGPGLEEMIARMRRIGEYLGQEIVLAVPKRSSAKADDAPVLLAEVLRPAELLAAIEQDVARINSTSARGVAIRIFDNAAQLAERPGQDELLIYVTSDLLAASPSAAELRGVIARQRHAESNRFLGTAFHARIAGAYAEGAGWLFAADMEKVLSDEQRRLHKQARDRRPIGFFEEMGLADLQHVIIEQKDIGGQSTTRGVLNFNQNRKGAMAWLAAPAPMGTLEFTSPDSLVVVALVVKDPTILVDELFALLQRSDATAWNKLLEFQSQHGVSIREDIAAPLGGEFLFALDGPMLPNPSWKAVVEVNDSAKLQKTLEWAVTEFNRQATVSGKAGLSLTQENLSGRTFYKLVSLETSYEVHYVFWDGYLIMAPSRTLLLNAIQNRDSGYTLARSTAFRSLLPLDGRDHCSGLLYQNLGPVLGSVSDMVSGASARVNPDQAKALQEIAASSTPTLYCLYGEKDRIVLASNSSIGFNLGSLAGFGGLMDVLGRIK